MLATKLTTILHFPGKKRSGILVAYRMAPVIYSTPININQPREACFRAIVIPWAIKMWTQGMMPEQPRPTNTTKTKLE